MQDIIRAYLSTTYSVNQVDFGKLQEAAIQSWPSGKKRLDQVFPFDIHIRTNIVTCAKRDCNERYIQKVYESSRTADERFMGTNVTYSSLHWV